MAAVSLAQRLKNKARRFLERPGTVVGLRRYEEMLPAIEAREADLLDLDDAELMELAEQAEDPEEICALGREAARRALGERAYDVQLLGVLAMLSGHVCEMATG